MPWRRTFESIAVPHDDERWATELMVLQPDETLRGMWVGIDHSFGLYGPDLLLPEGGSVLLHGLALVADGVSPPFPADDPFADWLLRDRAQWTHTQSYWSGDGPLGTMWSHHPTKKYDGQRRNDTGANLILHLANQLVLTPNSTDFATFCRTRINVEAWISD